VLVKQGVLGQVGVVPDLLPFAIAQLSFQSLIQNPYIELSVAMAKATESLSARVLTQPKQVLAIQAMKECWK
jgi:hypothetical protein